METVYEDSNQLDGITIPNQILVAQKGHKQKIYQHVQE